MYNLGHSTHFTVKVSLYSYANKKWQPLREKQDTRFLLKVIFNSTEL